MQSNRILAIIYTPLQRMVIENITNGKNVDIIDFYRKENIINNKLKKFGLITLFRIRFRLKSYNTYYLPHNYGVFSNYIMNKCNGEINYYYEGIMYIGDVNKTLSLSTFSVKKFKSLMFGFKFHELSILSLNDERVKKIFVPVQLKHLTSINIKLSFFKFLNTKINKLDKKAVLILGGVGKSVEAEFFNYIYKEIKKNPSLTFYYKPHPSEKKMLDGNKLFKMENIKVLDKYKSAEEVIYNFLPYKIISLDPSSSLLHAKLMNDDIITHYFTNKIGEMLKIKFDAMNIICIKL